MRFWQERAVNMMEVTKPPGKMRMPTTQDDKMPIRFEKCIGCPDMGPACLGPNLLMLSIADLREWVRRWKEYYALTIESCAAIWNTPAGTVSRFLSDAELDFKYMTVWSIVHAIVHYGHPAEVELGDNPCPASSSEIKARDEAYEQQIAEIRAECDQLRKDGGNRDKNYIERMAEQRENYEKHLADRESSVSFLRELAEKRQRDLEKEEAVSANYLERIDEKNRLLEDRDKQIRELNGKLLSIVGENAASTKALVDQMLRMTSEHAEEVRKLNEKILSLSGG